MTRECGSRFELVRMRPHDHIGWVFAGQEEFDALVRPFLAEGSELGERLMYVADDPGREPLRGFAENLDPGVLQIASTSEVYGPDGIVDAKAQRAIFSAALADALGEGYTGIRVAADNTPLVLGSERIAAWIEWEHVADQFIAEHAVTGLCAFDSRRVDMTDLRHLATLHPLTGSASGTPQFRIYSDDGALWIQGEIDSFAMDHVWIALRHLPAKTDVVVDITETKLVTRGIVTSVQRLCDSGVSVTVRAQATYAYFHELERLSDRGLALTAV